MATTSGLDVSNVVSVTVSLSPTAATYRDFGALLVMGSSDVISTTERIRSYTSLDGVAEDFGTTAPEYYAADLFFSQDPDPEILYIGRWAQTATNGLLNGGVLTAAEQALANFTAITAGSMKISIDGTEESITGINFSTALNLNGVANILETALDADFTGTTVTWDSTTGRFTITSGTTGTTSSVSYATAAATGTDISTLFKFDSSSASAPVVGIAAETAVSAVETLDDYSNAWYGLMFATETAPTDDENIEVAAYIEGASYTHIFGVTITSTTVLDSTISTDLASRLKSASYERTFTQYSSSSAYAVASMFARAFTVDFTASNSTITLKFKQEPGVTAETLTNTQASTLSAKNCNVFVNYNNDTAIIQEGVMANSYFFDEVHGTDWLQNAIQTDVYNLLYQRKTKIPQTDAGIALIVTQIKKTLDVAVTNGLVAPGVWNADGFGSLSEGDTLTAGYYVYQPPIADQSQATRETRVTPTIQCAIKLAGAVHKANISVSVNR